MAVLADPENLNVDPSDIFDPILVLLAMIFDVLRKSLQPKYVFLLDVYS
jgi:hypothetical protein